MPNARNNQISLVDTPFYHCVSRCVRRAFLCGDDPVTGRSFNHRRERIQQDAYRLSSIFFIDIAAIAVMSNHYHLVVFVDQDRATDVTAKEVVDRWHQLFSGTDLSHRFARDESIDPPGNTSN